MENTTISEVGELGLGVDSDLCGELLSAVGGDLDFLADLEVSSLSGNVEGLLASKAKRFGVLAWQELKRKHAHANKVGPVNALVALSNDSLNALKIRSLSSPVA